LKQRIEVIAIVKGALFMAHSVACHALIHTGYNINKQSRDAL